MTSAITAALSQLNKATERTYTIREEGSTFALVIPTGGEYSPVDANTMVRRLLTLTHAAQGRPALPK